MNTGIQDAYKPRLEAGSGAKHNANAQILDTYK